MEYFIFHSIPFHSIPGFRYTQIFYSESKQILNLALRITSSILTQAEVISLSSMTSFTNANLLYRATRDGFSAEAFHQKCDNYHNTLTIIKTNGNYVFGGFASVLWNEVLVGWIDDPKAFLFSLRRNGIANDQKFVVNNNTWHADYTIEDNFRSGPSFGGGSDISICSNSNVDAFSYSYFCITFVCPDECITSSDSWSCGRSYLAGSFDGWLTSEIEVYQLSYTDYVELATTTNPATDFINDERTIVNESMFSFTIIYLLIYLLCLKFFKNYQNYKNLPF